MASDDRVHVLSIKLGVTNGQPIAETVDGETVTEDQVPCARSFDPDW